MHEFRRNIGSDVWRPQFEEMRRNLLICKGRVQVYVDKKKNNLDLSKEIDEEYEKTFEKFSILKKKYEAYFGGFDDSNA